MTIMANDLAETNTELIHGVAETIADAYDGVAMLQNPATDLFMLPDLPTAAGSMPAGAFWKDPADSNRIKMV
jgi:hypothetical protein